MNDAAALIVGIDAVASGTVSGAVGDVGGHPTDPMRAACGRRDKPSTAGIEWQPPGQGSGPARPAWCTARLSAHAVQMVGESKAAGAHSRPEHGSTVACLEAPSAVRTYSRPGGKM